MKQHKYTILADIAANLTIVFAGIAFIAAMGAMASPLIAIEAFAPFLGVFLAAMAMSYVSEIVSQWLHEQAYQSR